MNKTNSFPRMHVSLYVSDIEKTVSFYNQFFGKPADKVKSDYAKYILDKPSLIISFVENASRSDSSFGHLGFQVDTKEKMEAHLATAKKLGLVDREEIGTACCYAVQDKFWVNDPDGHQWEVYYFHEDAEFNDPKYAQKEASACCTPAVATVVNVVEEVSKSEQCCDPASGCC